MGAQLDFITAAKIREALGSPSNQYNRLLDYLWSAGKITHWDAETKCGRPITCIRSRIPKLREVLKLHGWTIDSRLEDHEGGQHAVYYLVRLDTDEDRFRARIGVNAANLERPKLTEEDFEKAREKDLGNGIGIDAFDPDDYPDEELDVATDAALVALEKEGEAEADRVGEETERTYLSENWAAVCEKFDQAAEATGRTL